MNVDMQKLSPMMQQYFAVKEQHKDHILFFRLGDFYEMFYDDAILASKELELTLTGRDCGQEERAPMCGVPYHACDAYISRLIRKGYKVAICEQMENPADAKGVVKRSVIRVVTPGTLIESNMLSEDTNNFIACILCDAGGWGLACADISTGQLFVSQFEAGAQGELINELGRYSPSEIIFNDGLLDKKEVTSFIKEKLHCVADLCDSERFEPREAEALIERHFSREPKELGLEGKESAVRALGALLSYLYETQQKGLERITDVGYVNPEQYMVLDLTARRNLELTQTMRTGEKRGTLLWVLDKTKTAMGARLLRSWVEQPLIERSAILRRQDAVEQLFGNYIGREELREYLNPIYDLERLIGRISYQSANPRDLIAFKNSLSMLPPIRGVLEEFDAPLLKELLEQVDPLEDLFDLIDRAIEEDPPVSVREGGMIKEGFNEEADKLRRSKTEGKQWISELEARERERTGIKNLRIKYNKVFGYYLEVTNSFRGQVPEDYTRKQTLTNAERYITPELKELEDLILGAEDKLYALEYDLFCQVRDAIGAQVVRIQETARAVAQLDVLASLASVAQRNQYVRPAVNEKGIVDIKAGRHPVVELMIPEELFVSNDVYLDHHQNRLSVITGPNMAGKSTYMRQVALIVLMAQLGSFVPAASANIGICDRIFTRVGASDDLASGQSTFMVEMTEVANILRNATRNSLVILDEIGRGTSTFDGLSIAWAVIEHISDTRILGAKTLFATHYHELTELEGSLPGVNNYCIAVKEQGDNIVFLRKIIKGGADKSYGIQVAKLAGVPDPVILRAKELLAELIDADISLKARELAQSQGTGSGRKQRISRPDEVDCNQLTLFDAVREDDIIKEITDLELGNMTPIDALNMLYRLQSRLKNRIDLQGK